MVLWRRRDGQDNVAAAWTRRSDLNPHQLSPKLQCSSSQKLSSWTNGLAKQSGCSQQRHLLPVPDARLDILAEIPLREKKPNVANLPDGTANKQRICTIDYFLFCYVSFLELAEKQLVLFQAPPLQSGIHLSRFIAWRQQSMSNLLKNQQKHCCHQSGESRNRQQGKDFFVECISTLCCDSVRQVVRVG